MPAADPGASKSPPKTKLPSFTRLHLYLGMSPFLPGFPFSVPFSRDVPFPFPPVSQELRHDPLDRGLPVWLECHGRADLSREILEL